MYEKEDDEIGIFQWFLYFSNLRSEGVIIINDGWVMNQLKIAFKMCVYSLKLEHLMELSSSVFVA